MFVKRFEYHVYKATCMNHVYKATYFGGLNYVVLGGLKTFKDTYCQEFLCQVILRATRSDSDSRPHVCLIELSQLLCPMRVAKLEAIHSHPPKMVCA